MKNVKRKAKTGRKKSKLLHLFTSIPSEKKTFRVKCNFCSHETSQNGTRLKEHLIKCHKVSDEIKKKYISNDERENNLFINTPVKGGNFEILEIKNQTTPTNKTSEMSMAKRLFSPTPKSPRQLFFQKSKIDPFMDKMSQSEIDAAKYQLGKAIYSSGVTLSTVEHPEWLKLFKILRPAFKPPTRYEVSGPLLKSVYRDMNIAREEKLAAADSLSILCDGWSNIRNEGIINYVATTPNPILLKSVDTGAESHTGEYFANELIDNIEKIGPGKVFGLCTDNASSMKKAWRIVKEKFSHIQTYGCHAHTLHLIFTDLSKTKSLKSITDSCTLLVKTLKKNQRLTALLRKEPKFAEALKLPGKTRWGSLIICFISVLKNKHALMALAISEEAKDAGLEADIKKLILSEDFFIKIEGYINLLKPIADAITYSEGDDVSFSIVAKTFFEIEKKFESEVPKSPVLKKEVEVVKKIITSRKAFLMGSMHYAANLLDPRYKGKHLNDDEMVDATEVIYEAAEKDLVVDAPTIIKELAEYKAGHGIFSKPFIWKAVEFTKPSTWWSGMVSSTQLSRIASKFLQLPATSAAVERTFSRQSWIHSARRNRLSNLRVSMIVEIGYNSSIMEETGLNMAHGTNGTKPDLPNNQIAEEVSVNSVEYECESEVDSDTLMPINSELDETDEDFL